jgi:hypothetical protein
MPSADRFAERRYDLNQLVADAQQEPPWRVEHFAADGHLTVLSAVGGDGKTWLTFAMAAGVAHGTPVAGMGCKQGRAVILDAENGAWILGSRMKALVEGLPPDRVAIYNAEGLLLSAAADRAWMLKTIRDEAADLVVIDALRPLAPNVEENNSDAMAPVVIGAKQLARESGAAVVLIHHRGNDRTRDFRGSTVIRDQADILYVLEREEGDPERKWRRRLRCGKCRIAAEPDDRWLRIDSWHGQVTLSVAAEPGADDGAQLGRPRVVDDLEQRYVAAVAAGADTHRAVADALGMDSKHTTLRRARKRLVAKGTVVSEHGRLRLAQDGAKTLLALFGTPEGNGGAKTPSPFRGDDGVSGTPRPGSPSIAAGGSS